MVTRKNDQITTYLYESLVLIYLISGLEKDYKALMNAKDGYAENIQELMNSGFNQICIDDMYYDLQQLIETAEGEVII